MDEPSSLDLGSKGSEVLAKTYALTYAVQFVIEGHGLEYQPHLCELVKRMNPILERVGLKLVVEGVI